ncbi:Gfo/Idh/MocA family oxidoreductase [Roseimicrobium sp. ORNL1]|uniref:Gfo/Idh/MocA family protein n=1 Tax=Roseimicrobium sp. ORNL1 TaxID=2711231 RepID=UPI0013E1EC2B|nr:Gfo/Idh/MocA family oxidoreductase [Roseimicrobium sp. ORNL1]QIF00544.1 Gfo/Idh/MocA family oxidoreductase [Roseimicrobium sp. ORNL1]
MSKPVRIGIIGAGGIVKSRHLPALLAMPEEVEIVAVCNSSLESSRRFCAEHVPQAEPMEKWWELASRDDINVVWVGATPYMHSDCSVYALKAGKHVFCQARMARSLAEAQLMWEASISNSELVAALCPPPQGMRGDRTVRRLLAEGAIGRVHQMRLNSLNGNWLDPAAPAHWRQRVEISGLQVLTFGIYVEVIQRWLGDIVSVQADGAVITPVRDGYTVDVPDFLNVLCTFRDGARGNLCFSGVASHPPQDSIEIYGHEGTLTYNFITDEIHLGKRGSSEMQSVPIPGDEVKEWTVESDFVHAVMNPKAPRPKPDFLEGMKYMRVVQAAAEALESGELVRVAA